MSVKYVYVRTIKKIEERHARQWVSGAGADTKFERKSVGWYATFVEEPSAIFLGREQPNLKDGDKVKFTLERA